MSQLASIPPKYSPCEELSPLELVQSLLSGRLAAGAHVIVTSRPHTLTYLQVTGTNNTLPGLDNYITNILGEQMVQHTAQAEPGAGHPGSVRGGRLRLHTQLRGEQGQFNVELKIFSAHGSCRCARAPGPPRRRSWSARSCARAARCRPGPGRTDTSSPWPGEW